MQQPQTLDAPWYLSAFHAAWPLAYPHRNDAEALAAAPHIARLLGLKVGHRVLDVGCGAGRYSRALAARGMRMVGVDASRELLDEARRSSPDLPGTPRYVQADVRTMPFLGQFDAAISMFTSFGYFESRAEDVKLFRTVRQALVSHGAVLVDFLNERHVRATLVPEDVRVVDGHEIAARRWIEERAPEGGPVVCKEVHLRSQGKTDAPVVFTERVRLYTANEVDSLLLDAGLTPEGDRLGHVDGRAFADDAPRLVRVARRA